MGADKTGKLAATIGAIEEKWGRRTIFRLGERLRELATTGAVSSGFPALDAALPGGGLPRGRIVELAGAPSAGTVTLALRLVAAVQALGEPVAYLDLAQAFDPLYAAQCAVSLEQLLLIYPPDAAQALALAQELVVAGAGAIVLDLAAAPPAATERRHPAVPAERRHLAGPPALLSLPWDRLLAPLARAGALFLVLCTPAGGQAIPHTTLRLQLQRERWLYHHHDVVGYRTRITIVKNRLGGAGQSVAAEIGCHQKSDFFKKSDFSPVEP
jgi:recombination protein RecA